MHYYQFNIGEYASHTRHLSPIEDISYRRLLDLAYTTELPLTKDIRQLTRLINLREYSQEVIDVLSEFFYEVEEGWVHNRVIKEIERTGAKSLAAKNSAAKRWEIERKAKKMQTQCEDDANASKNNAFDSENDATQYPIPNTHNPIPTLGEIAETGNVIEPTQSASVCLAMKAQGILDINPSHQTLLALLKAGASQEEFVSAAIQAKASGKGFSYAIGIVKRQREEAAKLILHQGAMPNPTAYANGITTAANSIFKDKYIAEQTRQPVEIEHEPVKQIA